MEEYPASLMSEALQRLGSQEAFGEFVMSIHTKGINSRERGRHVAAFHFPLFATQPYFRYSSFSRYFYPYNMSVSV